MLLFIAGRFVLGWLSSQLTSMFQIQGSITDEWRVLHLVACVYLVHSATDLEMPAYASETAKEYANMAPHRQYQAARRKLVTMRVTGSFLARSP